MKRENRDFLQEANTTLESIKENLKRGLRLDPKDNEDFNSIRRALQKTESYMLNNELARLAVKDFANQLEQIKERQTATEKRSASSPRDKIGGEKKTKVDQLLEKSAAHHDAEKSSRLKTSARQKKDSSDDTESEGGGFNRK